MPARCKLAYIRAGIIAITGSEATGLISVEKVSNNPDKDGRIQEDVPENLPPPPRLCERHARAKSQPTCNFIHHHITLRRQIEICQGPVIQPLRNQR